MMLHKTNGQTGRAMKVEFEEMVQKRDGAAESGSSGDNLLKNARRAAMVRNARRHGGEEGMVGRRCKLSGRGRL